ncbi:hypothetical protein LS482_16260 [Sinomicrobium kalidii]|uniref:hypothetical protein n=1 Tax=Sinomicrobium kalidii TaxID=2900738 RepID=UPI001E4951A5|nr:hypothetical protein [Sinomicrobium kalidii]UGU15227.1 hypothetical protein LS482_16260 [Sinomicrobium kalidii]
MKMEVLFLAALLALGCKTKQVNRHKRMEEIRTEIRGQQDSVLSVLRERLAEASKKTLIQASDIHLESLPDSSGNILPLHYVHIREGDTIEQIKVEGGRLVASHKTKQYDMQSRAATSESEKAASTMTKNQDQKKSSKEQGTDKEVKGTGFQAGFWITAVIVVIVGLVVWRWFK